MNDRMLHKLGFARKLLLTITATLAIAIPVTFGLFHPTPGLAQSQAENSTLPTPVYSSVSIKPTASADAVQTKMQTKMMFSLKDGSFVARGVTLQRLIELAYHVQGAQISGPHDFLNKTKFDIDAKLDPSYAAAMHQQMPDGKGPRDQGLLKAILTNKFNLVTHTELRSAEAYDLVVDENGAKLQASGEEGPRMMRLGRGELSSSGAPLDLLTAQLSARLGSPVIDKTGLKGTFAFNLHWTPDPSEEEHLRQSDELVAPEPPFDANGPALFNALQDQLGLKLVPNTERVPVLVIDHAEEPSEN